VSLHTTENSSKNKTQGDHLHFVASPSQMIFKVVFAGGRVRGDMSTSLNFEINGLFCADTTLMIFADLEL